MVESHLLSPLGGFPPARCKEGFWGMERGLEQIKYCGAGPAAVAQDPWQHQDGLLEVW